MKNILIYSRNDLKLIFRDPVLYVFLFIPLIFILMLRYGLPALNAVFPGLEPYSLIILATLSLVTSMFPAFMYSFIILDEKDQEILTAIRVLPVSSTEFLIFRLLFITVLSFLFVAIIIACSGLADWSLMKILMVSLPISMIAPIMTLFTAGFARNKIEGATWMKGLNFIMFLPLLSYFVKGSYEYFIGVLPVYWIFKIFDPGYSNLPFHLNYIVALLYNSAFLLAGARIFKRRVFP